MNTEILYQNYFKVLNKIKNAAEKANRNPNDIKLLAVSKTQSADILVSAINAGIPIFAENYAQEFRDKYKKLINFSNELRKIDFHFIGHLQTNKVKYVVPNVSTIHTIDSVGLANEINKQANKLNKNINIFIQINTSNENNKSGIEPVSCVNFAKQLFQFKNLNLIGLMTIGTFSNNEKIIRKEFAILRNCLNEINKTIGTNIIELSMGMSHDFEIAIEEGATMVRVGTAIFGERNYL